MSASAMRDIADYIMEEELIDLLLEGACFTWSNGSISSRLHRFLVSPEWEGGSLGRGMHRGPAPFKFENMWLQVKGFRELVRKWWEGYEVLGSPSHRLAWKLRLLKEDLKRWNREVFGRVETSLATLTEELQALESKIHFPGLSDVERDRMVELQAEIGRLLIVEDTSWRQKSRATWLSAGNRNTAFFHSVANAHRMSNYIEGEPRTLLILTGQDFGKPNASSRQVPRAICLGYPSGCVSGRLLDVHPISQEEDRWRWNRQGKGNFKVSSFYHSLSRIGDPTFPWKGIWVSRVPSKVCFFDWDAAKGAILTIDNLRRRRMVVTEWCYMCKRSAETTDHLLIHCDYASEV
ncbi:hypothetical protein Acr_07g0014050 [Actinidia rufa]|uniref:Reverse transcriptase zinc-binding domain-containing protein n=1 Tax=Actinidia rufa TaxID=165716 RepID=A0A7J0EZ12_9ERIC|nr:hypothetical protein Acr_07g0014050 [Actinidia rufa]